MFYFCVRPGLETDPCGVRPHAIAVSSLSANAVGAGGVRRPDDEVPAVRRHLPHAVAARGCKPALSPAAATRTGAAGTVHPGPGADAAAAIGPAQARPSAGPPGSGSPTNRRPPRPKKRSRLRTTGSSQIPESPASRTSYAWGIQARLLVRVRPRHHHLAAAGTARSSSFCCPSSRGRRKGLSRTTCGNVPSRSR